MPPGNVPAELPVGEYIAQVESALGRLSPAYRRFFLEEILPLWVEQLSEGLDQRMTLYASAVKSALAEANKPVNQTRLAASLDMSAVNGRQPTSRDALNLDEVRGILLDGHSRSGPGLGDTFCKRTSHRYSAPSLAASLATTLPTLRPS